MSKLTVAAVILVLAAAISLTEADVPPCASKLTPCATYIKSNTTPGANCCNAVKDAVRNELNCLCSLYNYQELLNSLKIPYAAVLQLPHNCGESTDLSACTSPPPPTALVYGPPPPGQAEAADRIVWTGVTSLLLFLTLAVLY